MKIRLLIVTSSDGIISEEEKGAESHHEWASSEDWDLFLKERDKASLIIMGRKTYDGAKSQMKHTKDRLRIVFTRNPEKYTDQKLPGQLEFVSENVIEVMKNLEKKGYKEALHVGGAQLSNDFFKANLITEIWQTIEPIYLGTGSHILTEKLKVNLKFLSVKRLNDKGTLLLKYKVLK